MSPGDVMASDRCSFETARANTGASLGSHNARAVSAVSFVSAIAPLTSTMVVIVLPDIQRDLHIGGAAAGLVVATYLIALAIVQPLGGRLGDAWGRRRMLATGLAVVTVASCIAAFAPNYAVLLVARLFQAGGGGLAFPNAIALLRDRVPADRVGRSMGIVGALAVVSGGAGVPLAEALRGPGTWHAIFLVSAIQALAATLVMRRFAAGEIAQRVRAIGRAARGDASARRRRLLALGALTMNSASTYAFLAAVSLSPGGGRASTAGSAALLLFVFFTGSLVGAPVGGQLSDRLGRWGLSSLGLGALALGGVALAVTLHTEAAVALGGALVAGTGSGIAAGALQAAALDGVPAQRTGRFAGTISSGRYLGAALGSGLAAAGGGHSLAGVCAGVAVVAVTAASAAAITVVARRSSGFIRRPVADAQTARSAA